MITRSNNAVSKLFSVFFLALTIVIFNSCEPDLRDSEIPPAQFSDLFINLTLPKYQGIRTDGGAVYEDGGVRGLIIYRVSAYQYFAYERNCSYQPNEACATVNIHSSKLYMEDSCCGSTFSFSTGQPLGGTAWRPLRKYHTTVNGSELIITDQVE
jgi:nitrite reductase/ring-hydroxylating ferredoxin subunit